MITDFDNLNKQLDKLRHELAVLVLANMERMGAVTVQNRDLAEVEVRIALSDYRMRAELIHINEDIWGA